MSDHVHQTPGSGIHGLVAWTFADATALNAFQPTEGIPQQASGLTHSDLYRVGLTLDDGSLFYLATIAPPSWVALEGGGGMGPQGAQGAQGGAGAQGAQGAQGGAPSVVLYAGDGSVDDAIFGGGTDAVPRNLAGDPIQVDFAALFIAAGLTWVPGSVVTAEYVFNAVSQDSPPTITPIKVFTWVRYSIDGGSTWTEKDPSAALAISSNGTQNTATQTGCVSSGWTAVACSLPPRVQIGCSVYTSLYIPFDDLSCSLHCSVVPPSQWLGTPPGGSL